mgnify:CR=1 FL=1
MAQLLPVYVDKVLGAKERPPAAVLDCWGVLVAAASLEQLSGGRAVAGRLQRFSARCRMMVEMQKKQQQLRRHGLLRASAWGCYLW